METIAVTGAPRTAATEGIRFSLAGGIIHAQSLQPTTSSGSKIRVGHPGHREGRLYFNGFSQIVL